MKTRLIKLISALHSLRNEAQDDADVLNNIQRWLLELTLSGQMGDGAEFIKFQRLQEHFDMNLCSALLCWVGRQLRTLEKAQNGLGGVQSPSSQLIYADRIWVSSEEETALRGRVTIALSCIQGLLLLHPANQKLFRRASSFEYLLTVLSTTRPSHLSSPHLSTSFSPYPSPILFPSSPSSSKQSSPNLEASPPPSTFTILAVQTLEVILCALVDRPENARCFEDEKGLEAVVKVLKDRKVEGVVRIKAIEILYYYLLPEPFLNPITPGPATPSIPTTPTTPRTSPRPPLAPLPTPSKFAPLTSFIPQTPQKHSYRHSISTPLVTPTFSSSSATIAEKQKLRHKRNQSSLCGNAGGRGEFVFSSSWREGREGEKTPRAMRGIGSDENVNVNANLNFSGAKKEEGSPRRRMRESGGMGVSVSGARLFGSATGAGGGLKDVSNIADPSPNVELGPIVEDDKSPVPKSKVIKRKPVPIYYHDPDETPRSNKIMEAPPRTEMTISKSDRVKEVVTDMRGRRTEREKKELLRKIMPNVDALEERFKAMGLGVV